MAADEVIAVKLAERVSWMKPSATLAINARAKELKARGVDVISFAAGEPDFPTPEHVRRAACEALEAGYTRYTAVPGDPELRAEVARLHEARCGVAASASGVVVGCGAKQPIAHFFQAALDPGDEVVLPAPCWVSYPAQVRMAGAEPVFVETSSEDGYHLHPDALARAIGPRTKALVLNAPCNPTGACYTKEALASIAEVVLERGLWVLSDEIYWRVTFDGFVQHSIVSAADGMAARTLVVDGASKTYSMTGWRVGWAVGPEPLVAAISTLQGETTSCAPAFSQRAALAALKGDQSSFDAWLGELGRRRDLVVDALGAVPGALCRAPEGTFYAMVDVRGLLGLRPRGGRALGDSLDLASYLLDEARVAVVPGDPFHGPGSFRISFACSTDEVRRGVERIGAALSALG